LGGCVLAVILSLRPPRLCGEDSPAEPQAATKLLIAFSSYRERPRHPRIHFYEHDGVSQGKLIGAIDTVNQRSDYHPSLSFDGRLCAFASELENQTGRIQLWDLKEKKLVELPALNDSPNGQMQPTLSGDGKLLAFTAWSRPGGSSRWDLFLYDVPAKKFLDVPGVNTPAFDERMPASSGDGRWLAFTSNAKGSSGLTDIYLYDRTESKVLALPELNSPGSDVEPWLSADGRLIAFISDRPGGSGGRDIYLFDRAEKRLLPLPGLNSVAQEQSPALSPDGRYIVFVSERVGGEGERDIYLYDRELQKLLPTPGLNAKQEDIDPCIITLQS
jgi:dipeptidyl aminopeptidase/acylaminoacyl peptidase